MVKQPVSYALHWAKRREEGRAAVVAADAVHGTTIAASVDSGLWLGYLCSGDGKAESSPLPCVCATKRMGPGTGLVQGHAVMCVCLLASGRSTWPWATRHYVLVVACVCCYKPHDSRTGRSGDQGQKVWA